MDKDKWDKTEIVAGIIGSTLIPVAIFLAAYFISQVEKENTSLSSQAEHVTSLIEHLSSINPKEQLIAFEIAKYFVDKKQLPDELVQTITRISSETENSDIARIGTQVVLTAAKNSNIAEQIVKREFSNVAPRVYFHIPREELRPYAQTKETELESSLSNIGLVVPGIDLKAKISPDKNQLRYFRTDEKEEALNILNELKKIGIDAELVNLSAKYESSDAIRPRHYELWMGKKL